MALSFNLESSVVPPTASVVGFRGSEALTRPYLFDVYVASVGPIEIDPMAAVGTPATLTIADSDILTNPLSAPPPVNFSGIIGRFQIVRASATSTLYRATIVPKLWQLAMTKHSRVFTKMSVPDVLKAVLGMEGVANVQFRVTGSYSPEEHICQYRESSLDFIHRWMEREGLYYFFEHVGGTETMVVVDNAAAHIPNAHGPVRYHPAEGDMSAGRHFDSFITGAMSLPAMVRVKDYDYGNPSLQVMGMSPVMPTGRGEVSESAGDARFFNPGDGARLAQVRAEALRAEGAETRATGFALGLSPGYKFMLEQHPRASLDKEYLVTRHVIIGRDPERARSWGRLPELEESDAALSVDITAIPAELQYREPKRTAWPRVDGYELGVIDGPADSEYAQIDDSGRYFTKFNFDEMSVASTRVRMMQPHAGATEGWHFPLRKGTEVMLMFLGGDPDRPVIAGAIPNATTPSPITSGNNTKNVIQTGGRNRIEIEDQAGSERITIKTPKENTMLRMGAPNDHHNLILRTDGFGFWYTGKDTEYTIDKNWKIEVKEDLTESARDVKETYKSQTTKVEKNVSETFGSHSTNVSGDISRTTGANLTESVQSMWDLTVNGPTDHKQKDFTSTVNGTRMETITGGPYTLNITGTQDHTYEGDETYNTTGNRKEDRTGNVTDNITGNVEHKVSENITDTCKHQALTSITALSTQSESFKVKVGAASLEICDGYIMLDTGQGASLMLVAGKATLLCSDTVHADASQSLSLKGKSIDTTSTTQTTMNGGSLIQATAGNIKLN